MASRTLTAPPQGRVRDVPPASRAGVACPPIP